jgi:hypothetical protein
MSPKCNWRRGYAVILSPLSSVLMTWMKRAANCIRQSGLNIPFLIIRFFFGNERRSVPRLQLHLGDIAYKFVVLYLFILFPFHSKVISIEESGLNILTNTHKSCSGSRLLVASNTSSSFSDYLCLHCPVRLWFQLCIHTIVPGFPIIYPVFSQSTKKIKKNRDFEHDYFLSILGLNFQSGLKIPFLVIRFFGNERRSVPRLQLLQGILWNLNGWTRYCLYRKVYLLETNSLVLFSRKTQMYYSWLCFDKRFNFGVV